jgi:hypothetical protein
MTDKKEKGFHLELSKTVMKQMADDPDLKKAMEEEILPKFHQAIEAWKSGQYPTLNAALEALTGTKPKPASLKDLEMIEELEEYENKKDA